MLALLSPGATGAVELLRRSAFAGRNRSRGTPRLLTSLPVVGFGEGFTLGSDGRIGVSVASMALQSTAIVPEISPEKRPTTRLVPLSNVNEFVCQQLAIAASVIVGPQQHEPADRHSIRTERKHRHPHYSHPFSQFTAENIVRLDFRSL